MRQYCICVDDKPYEGSDDRLMAKALYKTLDKTILPEYNGHKKSLVQKDNLYDRRTWKTIFKDEIHCPERRMQEQQRKEQEEEVRPHYHFHR